METTTNYKLPQWVKADQIKMDDFNDAFGKIDAALSGMRPAAGTYTGDGTMMADGGQEIALGFKPKFIVITRGWVESQTLSPGTFMAGEAMMDTTENYLQFTETGFRVGLAPGNANVPVRTNQADTPYSYVAFH